MTTWPPCGASDADCLCGERAVVDRPCTPVVETKSPLSIACPTCNAPIGERCTSIGVTHGRRRRAVAGDGALDVAEQIASWLDERATEHAKTLASLPNDEHNREQRDEHGWANSYGAGWAEDIRRGAWRKESK